MKQKPHNLEVQQLQIQLKQLKDELKQLKNLVDDLPINIFWNNSDQDLTNILKQNKLKVINSTNHTVFEESVAQADKINNYLVYKNPLLSSTGDTLGVAYVAIDTTESKQREQQLLRAKEEAELASETKTSFLMEMSHDIRTPLNGILGYTQILHMQEIDPLKKQCLADILSSTRHLINLLNEIIDITYIEKGLPVSNSSFDLRELLEQIQELLLAQVKQKNIQLIIEISQDIPSSLTLDKKRLLHILVNLLSNAVKFTEQGHVKIRIDTNPSQELEFSIEDTGIGITEDKLELIRLKLYHQEHPNQLTGLGLVIVKKFINDLGGNIDIRSMVNVGTQIFLSIPYFVGS